MAAHRRRTRAGVLVAALLLVAVPTASSAAPSEDDVREARRAADAAAGRVAAIEVELATLSAAQESAWQEVQAAGEDYAQALAVAQDAARTAREAEERSAAAVAEREAARQGLGTVALGAYRSGGTTAQLGALLDAEGFEDLVRRTAVLDRLGTQADRTVQRFTAADLAARTLSEIAETAARDAERAADDAAAALEAAEAAQAEAEAQVAEAERRRAALVTELAALRGTAVAVERERQAALERERLAREEAAAAAERGVGRGGGTTAPGSPGTSAPPTTAPPSGGTTSPPASPPAPPPSSTPPSTPAPPPSTPTPTTPPASDPYGLGTGTSRGTAAQGVAAVAWAQQQVGKPYVWGGVGPDGFDCSGLTSQAWRAAGVRLDRTSRAQYVQVRKIRYADMRPGDLIFYGSNPADPQSITHVAMYAGNGLMVEAPRPGVAVRTTAVRWSGTMPYAGRP